MNRSDNKKYVVIILLIICMSVVLSCRSNSPKNTIKVETREVTDDLDNKITLPKNIKRSVSLAPNLTEIIFAIGAGDKLVGVTTFCNYPDEAGKIRKIGDTLKPNIENIIALKPDVVFVTTASQLESFTGVLEEQGIKVFVTNPKSLDEIRESIITIGEVFFGKSESVEMVADSLYHRAKDIEVKLESETKIKTFVQIDKSLYTIGKESFLNDLIEKAGGVSVTKDVETAFPKISKEKASALNPDVIILSDSPDNNEPNEVLNNSNAVKNRRVFKVNADILSRPGPRIFDALEQIAKSIHPNKFK